MINLTNSHIEAPKVRLGDITTKIGSGATPRGGKQSYKAHGISLIRSMNVHDSAFDYADLAHLDEKQARSLDNVAVEENDVLLNITGASVARCCMVPKNVLPARVNQHVAIVRSDGAKANPFYIHYCLVSPHYKDHLLSIAQGGATREALTKEKIEDFQISLPPLSTQRKVTAILSAYDDLIEKNARRIKILEAMAQLIYREWFVHFRFPGHEKVKMVESELGPIPEMWSVDSLGSVAEVNELSIKTSDSPERIIYIDIASVSTARIDKKDPMQLSEAPSRARRIVRHGDVIWSTVRPNRRSFAMILSPEPHLVVSTGFAVLTAKKVPYSYLYFATTTDSFAEYLTNHATGAAYPAVNSKDFQSARLLLPPKSLLDRFHSVAADMLTFQHNLHLKNANLRTTRDLLLPKLISGEVDASELDIAVPEEVET